MVLAEAVIFWIVLAVLLRRDLSGIARCSFRGGWKLAGLVAALFAAQALVIVYAPGQSLVQVLILALSQAALLVLVAINRHLPGAILFALGTLLNTTVMLANGGWMPITPQMYHFVHPERPVEAYARPPSSKGIILPESETRLYPLSDIVPVTLPWRRTALSIGDLLLIASTAQFILHATSKRQLPIWTM